MHRHAARITVPLLLATGLAAQQPSAFADLPVPTGTVPSNLFSIGKLVLYQQPQQIDAFSAFTRRFTSMPASSSATIRITNDCALVRDGTTWTAYSSMRGTFEPLVVSANAQLLNPTGQDNDSILLVRDGTTLHAFSGFVGTWSSRTITASALAVVQRHAAVLADGNVLAGMDAFTGQWHDVAVTATAGALSVDGTAGTAQVGTTLYGFSAVHGTWSTAAALANGTRSRNDDWALWQDGNNVVAFSGLLGSFATTTLVGIGSIGGDDLWALLPTPVGPVAYSAVTGAFTGPFASATAALRTSTAIAVAVDGTTLVGYSPLRGTTSSLAFDSIGETVAGVVGAALDRTTNQAVVYSAVTGQWAVPPGDVLPGMPVVTTTSALLPTGTGVRAFSARSGAFVPLAGTGLILEGNVNSAVAAAWNATHFHAFDGRSDRWLGHARTGTNPLSVQIWRTQAVVVDGNDVIGFGTQSGDLQVATMPEPQTGGRANSESSSLLTQNHVIGFAAVPSALCLWQFPEFRRVFPAGATFRLQLHLPQGDAAFLGLGLRNPQPQLLPGLGELMLDPAWTAVGFHLPATGEDRALVAFPVPATPALRGSEWFFQALMVPAAGNAWLTSAGSVLVL